MGEIAPRWLDADTAARYLCLRVDAFLRLVKAGRIPAPRQELGDRTARWDRLALDTRMEGGTASTNTHEAFNALARKIQGENQGGEGGSPQARGRHG